MLASSAIEGVKEQLDEAHKKAPIVEAASTEALAKSKGKLSIY